MFCAACLLNLNLACCIFLANMQQKRTWHWFGPSVMAKEFC